MKLYYRTLGEGAPLIILHGLFGSSDNWYTISKLFAAQFQVFLIDARNHGQSPHSEVHDYALMAQDLSDFIEDHQLQSPYLIGHSMGGKTVMQFITTTTIPLSKAVIVDISPKYYPPHHSREIAALQSVSLGTLTSRQEADSMMEKIIKEPGVRQFLLKNLYRKEDGSFHWRMNLDVLVNNIENIGASDLAQEACQLPVLFIKGAKSDYYIQPDDKNLILKIFPNSQLLTIADAGHWVQAEQPQQFFDTVLHFLLE